MKNRCSEGRTFLISAKECYLRVYSETVRHFESKERLGNVSIARRLPFIYIKLQVQMLTDSLHAKLNVAGGINVYKL